jgi:signal peptidase I
MATYRNGMRSLRAPIIIIALVLPVSVLAEIRNYTVAGESMSPALVPGDKVVVDTEIKGHLSRGDFVAITFSTSSTLMLKRVAAVPGDRVEFKEHAVWVNGHRVRVIDAHRWASTIRQLEHFGNKVPQEYYLILGDNPLNSRDSGRLGLISREHLKGKVIKVIKAGTN